LRLGCHAPLVCFATSAAGFSANAHNSDPVNNLFLFVNDPDGNWIEISAELETLAESRKPGRWLHEERTLNLRGHGKPRS
jgi:hypothetical protein